MTVGGLDEPSTGSNFLRSWLETGDAMLYEISRLRVRLVTKPRRAVGSKHHRGRDDVHIVS